MSYSIGDTILYGADGVCRITEISERKIGNDTLTYYILKPIYDEKSTIYVPTQNQTLLGKMKRILSEDEIYSAIESAKNCDDEWEENDIIRKELFRKTLDNANITDVIRLVRTLYLRMEKQLASGKRLRVSDEHTLKDCEKILFDELSLVLKIKRNQVQSFLKDKLGI